MYVSLSISLSLYIYIYIYVYINTHMKYWWLHPTNLERRPGIMATVWRVPSALTWPRQYVVTWCYSGLRQFASTSVFITHVLNACLGLGSQPCRRLSTWLRPHATSRATITWLVVFLGGELCRQPLHIWWSGGRRPQQTWEHAMSRLRVAELVVLPSY